jgi:hypothetical protein
MNKVLTAEEILQQFKPDTRTAITQEFAWAKEKVLAAMEAYKNQSSVSDEEDLEPSKTTASEPVATLACTSSNSIEQLRGLDKWLLENIIDAEDDKKKEEEKGLKMYLSGVIAAFKDARVKISDLLNSEQKDKVIATQGTMPEEPKAGIQNYPH